jgi:hypothetical protein
MRVALLRSCWWGRSVVPRPVRQLTAMLAWLSVLALPRVAAACSYTTIVIESSYPEQGARDVPTNAMLFVSGPLFGPGVTLERADGTPVEVEVRALDPSGFDVKPLAELEPNQGYVLRAPGPTSEGHNPFFSSAKSVEFTTGDGPATALGELAAPELGDVVQLVASAAVPVPCPGSQLCTDAEIPAGTTLEVRIQREVVQVVGPGPWSRTYGDGMSDGQCLTASLRDFAGNRSAPTRACKEINVEYPTLTGSPLTCQNYRELLLRSAADPGEDADAETDPETDPETNVGCTLRPAPRPDPARAWTLSSLFGAWLYRRARRARRAT